MAFLVGPRFPQHELFPDIGFFSGIRSRRLLSLCRTAIPRDHHNKISFVWISNRSNRSIRSSVALLRLELGDLSVNDRDQALRLLCNRHIVGNQNDRPSLSVQLFQQMQYFFPVMRIERPRRLIS
ncbi:MAG: hypothetical protein K0Q59_875 [Paenibacillus sp.]|nr:hypothetical protein [Paenibacillus sp.]